MSPLSGRAIHAWTPSNWQAGPSLALALILALGALAYGQSPSDSDEPSRTKASLLARLGDALRDAEALQGHQQRSRRGDAYVACLDLIDGFVPDLDGPEQEWVLDQWHGLALQLEMPPDSIEVVFRRLTQEASLDSELAQWAQDELSLLSMRPGKPFPAFTLDGLDGQDATRDDYAGAPCLILLLEEPDSLSLRMLTEWLPHFASDPQRGDATPLVVGLGPLAAPSALQALLGQAGFEGDAAIGSKAFRESLVWADYLPYVFLVDGEGKILTHGIPWAESNRIDRLLSEIKRSKEESQP